MRTWHVVFVAMAVIALPDAAFAQVGGGFFSGSGGASGQRLSFTFSLAGAYDSDVPVAVQSADSARLQSRGPSTMLTTNAEYALSGRRVQVVATAASAGRYAADRGQVRSVSHSAHLGVRTRLPWRMNLLVNQDLVYSPSYLYRVFQNVDDASDGDDFAGAPDVDHDLLVDDSGFIAYDTSLRLARTVAIARGHALAVSADYRYSDFLRDKRARGDTATRGLHGQYSFSVSRRVAITGGYRYRVGDTGYAENATTATEHGIDVGMNYTRPLSVSRSATIGFRVGTSVVDVPASVVTATEPGQRLRLTGELVTGYRFRRTWDARASYRRGLEYISELAEPVFNDSVKGTVSGYVARPVNLSFSAAYSTGKSAITRRRLGFETYTGSVNLRYAIARNVAAYGEYLYYFYDFGEGGGPAPDIAPGLERHGARVGLTLFVPAMGR